jgi:DNA-binding CsgD family transcriptional regulator
MKLAYVPQLNSNSTSLFILTHRQQTIAQLLALGKTRKEIANQLNVSLQAIHQIVLRMRERFGERPFTYYQKRQQVLEFYRCLVFASLLLNPNDLPEDMYDRWLTDTFLKEYQRAPLMLIKKIYKEIGV